MPSCESFRRYLTGLAVPALAVGLFAAQAPQFRSAVDLVTLDVTVLDRAGKPVTDLAQDEFILLENGTPQAIGTFAAVHSPVAPPVKAAWAKSAPVDVAVNNIPEQRLLVLVIDDATLPNKPWMVKTARDTARAFVEQLGPADRAAVVFTRDNRHAQDFTYDKTRLLAAVQRTSAGFLAAAPGSIGMPAKAADLTYFLSSINTLSRVSEYLSDIPLRKKAIVWLSVGAPLDTDQLAEIAAVPARGDTMAGAEAERSIFVAMRRAIDRAQRANVAIYGLSPAGIDGMDFYPRSRTPIGGIMQPSGRHFTEFLQAMASNTGGRAFVNTNDLLPGMAQVFTETSSYYLIGYSPNPRGEQGSYRRVEVKTTRPGLTIRTRPGYFVARPEVEPTENIPLGLSAISRILPDAGIPMRGVASAFTQADGASAVAMTVALDSRTLPAPIAGEVAMTTRLFDPEGREKASFTQQAMLCAQPGWCDISVVLPMKAGRHALRVGVEHRPSGRSGSVYLDAVVPDFDRNGVALSGLTLEITPPGPRAMDAAIRSLLPIVPTARRELSRIDRASVFFRIQQGGRRAVEAVSRTIQITDENDARVLHETERLSASSFAATRMADQRIDLPLDRLPDGRYLLTVSVGNERRQLVFVVR